MSKKFIIVKYAKTNWKGGQAPLSCSVYGTYSATECGIEKKYYSSQEEASSDLKKLREFNPVVDYGIVKLEKIR